MITVLRHRPMSRMRSGPCPTRTLAIMYRNLARPEQLLPRTTYTARGLYKSSTIFYPFHRLPMPAAPPLNNDKLAHVHAVDPPATALPAAGPDHITSMNEYRRLYDESINNPTKFFGERARRWLTWDKPFESVLTAAPNFSGAPKWFEGGKLNASVQCLDRHAAVAPNRTAIIYEADEPGEGYSLTYKELLAKVCATAAALHELGVRKGDIVTVYMSMVPEAVITLMAIVRLGAAHSCVFAGFSPAALKDRILAAGSKVVITVDCIVRARKVINAKTIVDEALKQCPDVRKVVVVQRKGNCNMVAGRDVYLKDIVANKPTTFAPVSVDSEHPLFVLYTSGSTGTPKGMQHATAGYLLGALLTTKHIFGLSSEDIMFTAGDIGWVTGHTYALYGPLLNGATSVIFESTPVYPSHTRYWDIVDKYKVTQFYVAPTALRLLRQYGSEDVARYDLTSLRVLGSVGEPIAEELWWWYFETVGRGRCAICDTYWLTESGSILCSSLPGVTPMKPGAAGFPFFGIRPALINPQTGKEETALPREGVLTVSQPWPSMARTIKGDYDRYVETYLKPFPGYFYTGDGALVDDEGFLFVTGRMDDVVNVSGHRLSTAEIEACLLEGQLDSRSMVAESAAVGIDDELTGQAIVVFIVIEPWLKQELADGKIKSSEVTKVAVDLVRGEIGSFAVPKKMYTVSDLPKTRSGKIMRRVLRKIVQGKTSELGELSTLANPQVVPDVIQAVQGSKL